MDDSEDEQRRGATGEKNRQQQQARTDDRWRSWILWQSEYGQDNYKRGTTTTTTDDGEGQQTATQSTAADGD